MFLGLQNSAQIRVKSRRRADPDLSCADTTHDHMPRAVVRYLDRMLGRGDVELKAVNRIAFGERTELGARHQIALQHPTALKRHPHIGTLGLILQVHPDELHHRPPPQPTLLPNPGMPQIPGVPMPPTAGPPTTHATSAMRPHLLKLIVRQRTGTKYIVQQHDSLFLMVTHRYWWLPAGDRPK